jgi:hypothetical protein
MTAKNRRPAGFGRPPISGTVRRSKADAHIAATPNTRIRNKLSAKRSMIVPQQSQMFTSFGLPGSQQLSQRKASSKGRPGPYGSQKAKRMRRPQSGNNASNKRKRTETSAEMQMRANAQQYGARSDMPVLSDEYLNQLNEEQLQNLLEHQKQLMAMQTNPQIVVQEQDGGAGIVQAPVEEGLEEVDAEGQQVEYVQSPEEVDEVESLP